MEDTRHLEWTQPALFEGGFTELLATFTVEVAGSSDRVRVGLDLRDPFTREQLAITTSVANHAAITLSKVPLLIGEVLLEVQRMLSPF